MAALTPQKKVVVFVVLVAAGIAANTVGYPIFFGIEFLFGSIFAMLVLQLLGVGPAIVAALAISSVTVLRWHHPYAIPILTLEVITVGLLHRRRKGMGLVLADIIYWVGAGIPLVYLSYRGLIQLPSSSAVIAMYEQAINGITNTLVARWIFLFLNLRSRVIVFPMRELVFNLLGLFVLGPSLVLTVHESREEFTEIDRGIRDSVIQVGRYTTDSLESWLGQKANPILQLASRASNGSADQHSDLGYLRALDPDLLAVGIIDQNDKGTAFSPEIDGYGIPAMGQNFLVRPYLDDPASTRRPHFSEGIIPKTGRPEPVTVILAPIVTNGVYKGFAAGVLSLERVRRILSLNQSVYGLRCTLLDRNNRVIATNRDDLATLTPFSLGAGEYRSLPGGIKVWQPALSSQLSMSERWRQSSYLLERKIGQLAGWQLIIEQPVADFQLKFHAIYGEHLQLTFLFLLATLVCAEIFSRRVMAAVEGLQAISSGLSGKLTLGLDIVWPTSHIREVEQLIVNFREMARILVQKISETQQLNLTLEARVDERTRALRESEAKHRIIFENRIYAIYIFDLATRRILDVNQAFTVLYGYSREEVLGGMTIEAIHTWADEGEDLAIQETGDEGSIFTPLRYHRKKDGSIFPVEIVGGSYLWQGQRVMFAIANDITERRMATETLMERTAQLEDLTRNLEVRIAEEIERRFKNEQLLIQQAKLATMGEMLGAVAHQWRQPLNTLGLCVQNIKDSYRYGELSQEYLDATVRQAMEQIGHMSKTIDDFRNFFKPDKEKVEFNTMLAVGEVLNLFAAQLAAHDITFTLTCRTHGRTFVKGEAITACPAKTALGYENEFEHVILNLVNNAKEAIRERRNRGEMAADESGHILFEFMNAGPTLVITVSDNGGGIPNHVIGRIFEPYFTTKEPTKGTGIGLHLAKSIIEDHMHGTLTVENTGQGASFVITVPAVEAVAT